MKSAHEQLAIAISLAAEGHKNQFDRGGRPYILHPLKVMHYLKTDDYELMAIAVLHDLIEDTKFTFEDLRNAGLSDRVVEGVRALTKNVGETYEEYKERVKRNIDAVRVKMSDLRHNSDIRRLKGVTQKDIERIVKYQKFYLELEQIIKDVKNA